VDFFAYLSFCFAMSFTPGPNNLMSMALSRKLGFRNTVPFLAGLHLSLFTVCTLTFLFIRSLMAIMPHIEVPLKAIGSAYMLFLTYKLFKTKHKATQLTPDAKGRLFFSGMLLNLTNVKVALIFFIGYTSFILEAGYGPLASWLIGLCMYLFCSAANFTWAFGGSFLDRFFANHEKAISCVLAAMLVYCAVRIWL
jgi:cysteine/O-acetylserine efflux protein